MKTRSQRERFIGLEKKIYQEKIGELFSPYRFINVLKLKSIYGLNLHGYNNINKMSCQ